MKTGAGGRGIRCDRFGEGGMGGVSALLGWDCVEVA
jgi:hypothetical protein